MIYAGLIVFQGDLNWLLSIIVAGTGACLGVTISYWIGHRLGSGAFIWVSIFISIGEVIGPNWERYHHSVNRYMMLLGVITAII
ncbi:MAG: hypothetical protein WDZ91_15830 [Paenibacillaceae bacterium]